MIDVITPCVLQKPIIYTKEIKHQVKELSSSSLLPEGDKKHQTQYAEKSSKDKIALNELKSSEVR